VLALSAENTARFPAVNVPARPVPAARTAAANPMLNFFIVPSPWLSSGWMPR